MSKKSLRSVNCGLEWDLSQDQINFLTEEMRELAGKKMPTNEDRISKGKYYPHVPGKYYGYIEFEMPENGYLGLIDISVFRKLNDLANKADTRVYINNTLPNSIGERRVPRIMFCASSH